MRPARRYWILAVAAPSSASSGPTPETTGPGAGPSRRGWRSSTLVIEPRPRRRATWRATHGVLQTDGYAAYKTLAARSPVELAFCWAHTRRYFHKELDQKNPEKTPIAAEALSRIQHLYAIEAEIRGRSAEERRAVHARRRVRRSSTALRPWLAARLDLLSKKSDLAKAIRTTLSNTGQD